MSKLFLPSLESAYSLLMNKRGEKVSFRIQTSFGCLETVWVLDGCEQYRCSTIWMEMATNGKYTVIVFANSV